MKNILTSLLTLIVLSIALEACTSNAETRKQQIPGDAIPVKLMPLSKSGIASEIHLSGQLTTDDETVLSFKTGGVIQTIFVKEGDAIRKGQVLATLDLTEIRAQVAQARLALEKSKRDFERVERLYKDSVATLEQFQNSRTAFEVSQKQFEAADFNMAFSQIRALSNGFVLKKFANEGQVITSGTAVLQTNGAKEGTWKLRCGASDREWASIRLNDKAIVTIDASGESMPAIVSKKSEGTDPSSGLFTIELTLSEATSKALASGMFGKVSISTSQTGTTWTIPFDALLDGDGGNGYVFVTNDNKVAIKTEVQVGKITSDHIQITSGLETARALIISGSAYLKDQSPIYVAD